MRQIISPLDGIRSPFGARFGFSPAILFAANEPGLWLDPSDLTTLFQDAAGTTPVTTPGQPVGCILDKSGRGNHATQSTAASRPTYQVDAGGRGYLSFDGVDDFLVTPTITPNADKVQVFAGVRKLSDAATGTIVELSTTSQTGTFSLTESDADYGFRSRGTASGTATGVATSPITNVVTGLGDIAGDIARIRVNGAGEVTSTSDQGTGNFLAYPLFIGRRGGTSLPANIQLFGLIVRFSTANLDAGLISQTERWMAQKTAGVVI